MQQYILDRQAMGEVPIGSMFLPTAYVSVIATIRSLVTGVVVEHPNILGTYAVIRLVFIEGNIATVRVESAPDTFAKLELL